MGTRKCPKCRKRLRYPEEETVCPGCGFEVAEWFEANQQGIAEAYTGSGSAVEDDDGD